MSTIFSKFLKTLFFIILLIFLYLFSGFAISKINISNKIKEVFFPHFFNKELSKQVEDLKKTNLILEKEIQGIKKESKELQTLISRMHKHIPPYEYDAYIKSNLYPLVFSKNSEWFEDISGKKRIVTILKSSTPFLTGIDSKILSGSAYIDNYKDNLFLITAIGIIGYGKLNDEGIIFKQIKNNIENFIGLNQFKKGKEFSVKDLKIIGDRIYVSFTEEKSEDCWTTSIIYSKLSYDELNFQKLFSPNICLSPDHNLDTPNEFNGWQSGGRIEFFDQNHILLTTGAYRLRFLAQKDESLYGKILKININTGNFKVVSMGHRNPQGLHHDRHNNLILSTEHGPKGGDEINLIKLNEKNIPNYGWPIASYGEHYDQVMVADGSLDEYPLLKSHKNNGFIEPLKYFVPSIGISEIISLNNDKSYVVSSMRDKSLYFFNLDNNNQIEKIQRVEIGERIRDLMLYKNKVIMFLENTVSIGIVE